MEVSTCCHTLHKNAWVLHPNLQRVRSNDIFEHEVQKYCATLLSQIHRIKKINNLQPTKLLAIYLNSPHHLSICMYRIFLNCPKNRELFRTCSKRRCRRFSGQQMVASGMLHRDVRRDPRQCLFLRIPRKFFESEGERRSHTTMWLGPSSGAPSLCTAMFCCAPRMNLLPLPQTVALSRRMGDGCGTPPIRREGCSSGNTGFWQSVGLRSTPWEGRARRGSRSALSRTSWPPPLCCSCTPSSPA